MATFALILQAIVAVLKFPAELSAFIRLISKSPEEKRQEILKTIEAESAAIDAGERPKWDV